MAKIHHEHKACNFFAELLRGDTCWLLKFFATLLFRYHKLRCSLRVPQGCWFGHPWPPACCPQSIPGAGTCRWVCSCLCGEECSNPILHSYASPAPRHHLVQPHLDLAVNHYGPSCCSLFCLQIPPSFPLPCLTRTKRRNGILLDMAFFRFQISI